MEQHARDCRRLFVDVQTKRAYEIHESSCSTQNTHKEIRKYTFFEL